MKRKEREKPLADDATENDLTLASTALQIPKPLVRARARGRGYKTERVGHRKCERRRLRIHAGGGEAGERRSEGVRRPSCVYFISQIHCVCRCKEKPGSSRTRIYMMIMKGP
jgi:hypothetical protein